MKKNTLIFGILALVIGVVSLTAAFIFGGNMTGFFFGLGGAGAALGIGNIISYFYWSSQRNNKRYEELLENKSIEVNDELNSKVRDRCGRITCSVGFGAVCVTVILLEILEGAGLISGSYLTVMVLCAFLFFQMITYIIVFSSVRKKF